ncbi:N-acetylneuraminate lyase-like [Ruditapes philippinarum]|uniref:N-acetylneuraminate lyase-like n=1 Tax=Ruditapes philippinarum TaxID=129788 RepID=UPI00295BC02A|nr:N-acetylneuraminate lyase-like [Ruditapes philippinarum]
MLGIVSRSLRANSARLIQRCTMSTQSKLEGMVVAPYTPFNSKGEVDYTNFETCAKYFEKSHFNGMFVNGTLAEGMSLSCKERMETAEKWKEVSNRLFIILHIGTGNLKESQELAKHAESIGVDAIAALPPTYHKPTTEEQLVAYIEEVAGAAPNTPMLYYEYNVTTGVYLKIPRFLELAENRIPTLYGLKHTSPELSSAVNCANVCNEKYKVFFGTETQYLPTLCLGIPDVITSPYLGKCFYNLKAAFEKDERELAQEYQLKAQQLNNIQMKHGGGISCSKALFEIVSGITMGAPRLPLSPVPQQVKDAMKKDLIEEGFLADITFTEEDFDSILLTY